MAINATVAGAYIVETPEDSARLLPQFASFKKLASWLALHVLGVPTLRGAIVTRWSNAAKATVVQFARNSGFAAFLIRSDASPERPPYPRGGFVVPLERLPSQVLRFLEGGRVVYLLEPRSPFDDLYSLNVASWPEDVALTCEVVGPGFDASDLKRGDFSPHETFLIDKQTHRILEHRIVPPEEYKASRRRRLEKAAHMFVTSGARRPKTETPSRWAQATLLREGHDLLFRHSSYPRIPWTLLIGAISTTERLVHGLTSLGFPAEPLVVSMSYVGRKPEPIYWDVVWPSHKYAV